MRVSLLNSACIQEGHYVTLYTSPTQLIINACQCERVYNWVDGHKHLQITMHTRIWQMTQSHSLYAYWYLVVPKNFCILVNIDSHIGWKDRASLKYDVMIMHWLLMNLM